MRKFWILLVGVIICTSLLFMACGQTQAQVTQKNSEESDSGNVTFPFRRISGSNADARARLRAMLSYSMTGHFENAKQYMSEEAKIQKIPEWDWSGCNQWIDYISQKVSQPWDIRGWTEIDEKTVLLQVVYNNDLRTIEVFMMNRGEDGQWYFSKIISNAEAERLRERSERSKY